MKKYDFENMGSIWKDEARTITENGVFVPAPAAGIYGNIPGRFTASRSLDPAAVLRPGALSLIFGDTFAGSARSADILQSSQKIGKI